MVAGGVLSAAVAGAAWLGFSGSQQQPGPAAHTTPPGAKALVERAQADAYGTGAGSAQQLPPGHPPVPSLGQPAMGGAKGAPSGGAAVSGRVVEVLQVPGYTYLKLKGASEETWAAVPTTEVAEGAEVVLSQAMLMQNFHSKTLQRTFEKIYFGSLATR